MSDNGFQHLINVFAGFCRNTWSKRSIQADYVLNIFANHFRLCAGKINFINDRDDFQVMVKRHIAVCQCLCFDSLCRINDQKSTFTGGQSAADFISKVNMTGRIDQVQLISLSISGCIVHPNSLAFDGYTALPLKLHGVQNLFNHLTLGKNASLFKQAVSKRAFTMINMGYDAEVANL